MGDFHSGLLAMLLQMAFEKIAKAAIARSDGEAFRKARRSHAVMTRFLRIVDRQARVHSLAANQFTPQELRKAVNLARSIEALHPAIAKGGPHLEYPWEDADGVRSPVGSLPLLKELADPCSRTKSLLLRFAAKLHSEFDVLFGL